MLLTISIGDYFLVIFYSYCDAGNSAGATWLNKTSSKNDMFTRLHEDPMLLIKQNEKRVRFNYIFAYVFSDNRFLIYHCFSLS